MLFPKNWPPDIIVREFFLFLYLYIFVFCCRHYLAWLLTTWILTSTKVHSCSFTYVWNAWMNFRSFRNPPTFRIQAIQVVNLHPTDKNYTLIRLTRYPGSTVLFISNYLKCNGKSVSKRGNILPTSYSEVPRPFLAHFQEHFVCPLIRS